MANEANNGAVASPIAVMAPIWEVLAAATSNALLPLPRAPVTVLSPDTLMPGPALRRGLDAVASGKTFLLDVIVRP
jgi:hypothetical protein